MRSIPKISSVIATPSSKSPNDQIHTHEVNKKEGDGVDIQENSKRDVSRRRGWRTIYHEEEEEPQTSSKCTD